VDAWSRDSRFLVLDCGTGGGNYTDLVLLPLDDDRTIRPFQVSAEGGTEPRWSPDGHTLYYRNRGQLLAVSVGSNPSFSVSRPLVLLDRFHPYITDTGIMYDATTDDQHFVTTLPVSQDTLQRVAIVLNWGEELNAMTRIE
jgi:dipeptidyl aminopeptidase/acylaminoacyl peptidase